MLGNTSATMQTFPGKFDLLHGNEMISLGQQRLWIQACVFCSCCLEEGD